jgi:hypothetical protein
MTCSAHKVERFVLSVGLFVGSVLVGSQSFAAHAEESEHERHRTSATEEAIVLGVDQLTTGIPGTGPLTLEEIRVWLKNADNHRPLTIQLPLGLGQSDWEYSRDRQKSVDQSQN